MPIRISNLRRAVVPAQKPATPLYQLKLQALLPAQHPLFRFTLVRQCTQTTFDFEVGLRDLAVDGGSLNEILGHPVMLGSFPGFWFDRLAAAEAGTDLAASWQRFEAYAFKICARLLEHLHRDTRTDQIELMVCNETGMIWPAAQRYLELLTARLPFACTAAFDDQAVSFLLRPVAADVCPIEVAAFEPAEAADRARQLVAQQGLGPANLLLKKWLLELLVLNLYHARWIEPAAAEPEAA